MTRADGIKLGILVFLIFILCLPEFFLHVPQIHFLCETIDPCTPEDVLVDVCGKANPPCMTEMRNSSSQVRPTGWYLCKSEMDSHVLRDNTSESEEHVMVMLTLKGDNRSEWNISVFLNHTELYTGSQNPQRLFYCFLPPNKSKCPDINTEEYTQENSPQRPVTSSLKTTTSARPVTSLLKNELSLMQKLNCQLPSSGYLFHYQENQTARSAFPRTQVKNESWWSVITGVWFILVVTLMVLTSVGCLVYKNRRACHRTSHLGAVSASDYQLREISEQRGNLTRSPPDAFVTVCSVDENQLTVNVPYNRGLSPICEITENSVDEDCDEGEEEKELNSLVTKQEFKESQGICQTSAHLHRCSNPSCSCHETDGEL